MFEATRGAPVKLRFFVLHVFALCGFALAQPVYSWISAQPEFLVAHGAGPAQVLFLVALLSLALPLLLLALVLPWRLFGKHVFFSVQALILGFLLALLMLYALPLAGNIALVSVMLAGAFVYWRFPLSQHFLTVSALAALFFPVFFIFSEPVRPMVFSGGYAGHVEADHIESEKEPQHSVVMLLLDELSMPPLLDASGRIDAELFPNFSRLAEGSTWFPNASTVYSSTTISMLGLTTGRIPQNVGKSEMTWYEHPDNLFTWMPAVYGPRVTGREAATNLCPDSFCPRPWLASFLLMTADAVVLAGHASLPESWTHGRLPPMGNRWNDFLGMTHLVTLVATSTQGSLLELLNMLRGESMYYREALWQDFLTSLEQDNTQPSFHFMHILLPHVPYHFLPEGETYTDVLARQNHGGGLFDSRRIHHELELQRFVAQTRYTDSMLGELLDKLQDNGLWEDTLLIVLSDHGRTFRRGSQPRIVDHENIADILNIPLFVKLPGQDKGRIDDFPASIIDIVPTIAEVLGYQPGWEVEGISLVAAGRPEREAIEFSCAGRFRCAPDMQDQAGADERVEIIPDNFVETRSRSSEWFQAQLDHSGGPGLSFPTSAETALLGRFVTDYEVNVVPEGRLELFESERFAEVDLDTGHLPALAGGYLKDVDLREDESLIVALNDRLAAVGIVDEHEGRQVFGALLPAHAFVEGENELRVFRVEWENGQATGLNELAVVPAS